MHTIVTVIGARPQIIKAAAVSRSVRNHYQEDIREVIVHTGQHYDNNMSQVFIDELEIPRPAYNLGVGSATHGIQTARMIEGIESILEKEKPGMIILYGDTNSTLAGAVAASKIHVPVAHIEAGLRSFNKSMPEEINRIVCDHCSTLLFSPTLSGYNNLVREGFNPMALPPYHSDNPKIYHCGDVMFDNSLHFAGVAEKTTSIIQHLQLQPGKFILSTIHRNGNTDVPERLESIFRALLGLSEQSGLPVILPIHPRTAKMLELQLTSETLDRIKLQNSLRIIPPASFLEMLILEKNAALILTDSGGVQKEAYFFRKPAVILRAETEWTEIIEAGAGRLCDASEEQIVSSGMRFLNHPPEHFPEVFGDGRAADYILSEILAFLNTKGAI